MTETSLKIIQRDGARSAVKLEAVFWSQLKDFAREDKVSLSELIYRIWDKEPARNRTALLRCYCLDRWRKNASLLQMHPARFDMLALIAACPTPVVIITHERKIAAFNPAFSAAILTPRTGGAGDKSRALAITLSEPMRKLQQRLIDDARRIPVLQVGFQAGGRTSYHKARCALADRSAGLASLLILFLETV
jgi:predicted DNA-binding ribbon-helix-helix protein